MILKEIELHKVWEEIEENYFTQNFGTMSKTDLETLIFHHYLLHLKNAGSNCDDYVISKQLGITQSKVRSLKVRNQLRYPEEDTDYWKNDFVSYIKNASYIDGKIKMIVPDVNVLAELRYFVEQQGWFDDYQLNPKLFQCEIGFFVELCNRIFEANIKIDDKTKKKLEELKKQLDQESGKFAIEKIIKGSLKEGLAELAKTASKQMIMDVLKILPFGGTMAVVTEHLIEIFEKTN